MTLQAHNAAKAEYDRSAALRIRAGPSNPPATEITTFKESVSVIKITSLTILSASLFRLSPSFSRRLYHAENLWLGSLMAKSSERRLKLGYFLPRRLNRPKRLKR